MPWSGAPDCPVCHRTVSGAPGAVQTELFTFGFLRRHSTIIHQTVRCAKRSNGSEAQRSTPTVACNVNNARTDRAESEQRSKVHRTVNSACPVRHQTVRCTKMSELQRSNPNGWVTWLAHRTVRCARRQTASPTSTLVVGAINTPNHHTSRHPSFQPLHSIQEL